MYFLDELIDSKLYKRKFLLPIDEKEKRKNCSAFLLSPNIEASESIIKNPMFVNRYYNSYYMEQASLYIINQQGIAETADMSYINEDYDIIKAPDISFSGYDIDVAEAKKYITKDKIKTIARQYGLKKERITVDVSRTEDIPYSTNTKIYIQSKYTYNDDAFKSYDKYCNFCINLYLIRRLNPDIKKQLALGAALYSAGYFPTKFSSWKFTQSMWVIVSAIDMYVAANSWNAFVFKVLKPKNGYSKLTVSWSDIVHFFTDTDVPESHPETILSSAEIQLSDKTGIIISEDTAYNPLFKRILYNDRIKTIKDLKEIYTKIKKDCPRIKYAFNKYSMYKNLNMFIDTYHYNMTFLKNNTYKNFKGAKIYIDLIDRLINDKKYNNYKTQTIIIPVNEWYEACGKPDNWHLIANSINPISCIFYLFIRNPLKLKELFKDRTVLFLGNKSYMKINFANFDSKKRMIFLKRIQSILLNIDVQDDVDDSQSSPKAIKVSIIDSIEKSQNLIINNISAAAGSGVSNMVATAIAAKTVEKQNTDTPKATKSEKDQPDTSKVSDKSTTKDTEKKIEDETKAKLVAKIDDISKTQTSVDGALDAIDAEDKEIKKLLSDLASNPDNGGSNISGARASRLLQLQDDFLDSKYDGVSIRDIISEDPDKDIKVEPKTLNVDSINEEWKNLKYANSMDSYNMDHDIVKILGSFYNMSNPLVVRELSVEDTSTSEDLVMTYTCKYESARGERFTIKIDVPKFVDNKYMKLGGNRKNLPIQLFLMPIIKTGEDAVQIVSCYKKMFIRRFGENTGKSNAITDKLIKALNKEQYQDIKIVVGDNSRVCSKYELPIDYIDLASSYSTIETPKYLIMFNQDTLRSQYKVDDSKGLCFGIEKSTKEPLYFKPTKENISFFSSTLFAVLTDGTKSAAKLSENFDKASRSVRYTYSRVSVLGTNIPLIVVCAYSEGLETVLRKAKIKYKLSEKRPTITDNEDYIKFKDGYLMYELTYASSLLMNGLKACNTDDYSVLQINSKQMYTDFLELFGGRIKADGLDNFYDCMLDPITLEVLNHYKLPTDYISVLLYANMLLTDNKFVRHGDIRSTRRFRRQEQIPSMLYDILATAYGDYSTGLKHGRNVGFSVKQSALVEKVMINNTTEDQSILNALGEYEAYNSVSPKGASGMNSDRAYGLDKRSYDPSMFNVLSASTGFAGTVGIAREATIDANVQGARGYIYNDPSTNVDEVNSIKSLCMTEALNPYSSTRDDPMRLAMGFIQTQKHGMRSTKADPLLITTGADEALPYLVSNTFAYKAKDSGVVKELTDDYMIIEYANLEGENKYEYVDLTESVQKNSSSGFYISLKLDTDLKVGSKVKKDQIVAYDKESFSDEMGSNSNIAYKIGTLAKFAILNTDEGYEDSAIVSDDLSEGLASDIVLCKDYTIPKDANVYNLVKKGQDIQEGDPLMILQNSYDDEDVNILLKNLVGDEKEITNLGRIPITSKVTGVVQDIIITRTVETSELSPTLKKIVNEYERDIKNKKKLLDSYGIKDDNHRLPDAAALPAKGKLKNAADSVRIEIYLKYHDKFKPGDKLIYGTAVKGVDKDIFPKGEEPYSQYRPNEKIHALLSIGSINARMVTSVLINTGINKGLIELSRKCKDILGIKYDDNLL